MEENDSKTVVEKEKNSSDENVHLDSQSDGECQEENVSDGFMSDGDDLMVSVKIQPAEESLEVGSFSSDMGHPLKTSSVNLQIPEKTLPVIQEPIQEPNLGTKESVSQRERKNSFFEDRFSLAEDGLKNPYFLNYLKSIRIAPRVSHDRKSMYEKFFTSREHNVNNIHERSQSITDDDTSSESSELYTIEKQLLELQIIRYANQNVYEGMAEHATPYGIRSGRGKLQYKNGDFYEGLFSNDCRHGSCYCEYANHPTIKYFTAHFYEDRIDTTHKAAVTYLDGSRYVGTVRPIGKDKFAKGKCIATSLVHIIRSGKGEFHWKNGDRYFGSWSNDKISGWGIYNFKDENYYGHFFQGKRHGFGILLYKDGSFYEGEWSEDEKHGKGTLILSCGHKISGSFKHDKIKNATIEQLDLKEIPRCSLILLDEQLKEVKETKMTFMNGKGILLNPSELCGQKWNGTYQDFHLSQLIKLSHSEFRSSSVTELINEAKKQKQISQEQRDEIISEIMKWLDDQCKTGVIKQFITSFKYAFEFRYHNISHVNAKLLRPQAIDDVQSFVRLLSQVVGGIIGEDAKTCFSSSKLQWYLKNMTLREIHKRIFEIYRFFCELEDAKLRFKLKSLKTVSMKELGCKEEFIPSSDSVFAPYGDAINILRGLPNCHCPHDKFEVLVGFHQEITAAMDLMDLQRHNQTDRGADSVLPVCIYVFIQANVRYLYSEFTYMSDFYDSEVQKSEQSGRFSIFESCLRFSQKLHPTVRDQAGVMIPPDVLIERLSKRIKNMKSAGKNGYNLMWLSSFFIALGNTQLKSGKQDFDFKDFFSSLDESFNYAVQILEDMAIKVKRTIIEEEISNPDVISRKRYTYSFYVNYVFPPNIYHTLASELEQLIRST